MPRVAREIKCNENDILALESIVRNPLSDPRLSEKATAILLCIEGLENKDVALKLNVRKNTVGDWRKAYIENGIEGLKGKKRPGRRGNSSPDVRELVKAKYREKPEDGEAWTAKSLGAAVGTSVDTVRRALREEGISLERKTCWKVPVNGIPSPAAIGFAGIYLSDAGKAVVIFTSRDEKVVPGNGDISGRGAASGTGLEDRLSRDGYVPIADALEILSEGGGDAGRPRRGGVSMQGYLNGIGRSVEGRRGVLLHSVVLYGKGEAAPALSCPGMSVTLAPDFESWLTLIGLWVEPLCGAESVRVRAALSRYTDEYMASREPVIWNAGIADAPAAEDETAGRPGGAFSDPSVQNVLRVSATITGRDGREIRREAEIPNGVPGLGEISYESPLALGASVGRLERAVHDGMNGVARALCEGYMDEALKKTAGRG